MFTSSDIRECVKIYENVIENLAELIIKLGFQNDTVIIYEIFNYMYRNGYFSYNGIYCDVIPKRYIDIELYEYIEMDIAGLILLCGFGVCRHVTNFLNQLYQTLGYDSAQLFTYSPKTKIKVDINGKKITSNSEIQEYIDLALAGIDLFSREEIHINKEYDGITVDIIYYPIKDNIIVNHTVNTVVDKKDTVHILDPTQHYVGEKIDDDRIKFNKNGLTHVDFIQRKNISFNSYYGTNYYRCLGLLDHKSNIGIDILTSALYGEKCKEYISYYEQFRKDNQKNYTKVENKIFKVIRLTQDYRNKYH